MKSKIDDLYVNSIIDNDVNDIPQPNKRKDILNMPTSVGIHMVYKTYIAGKNIEKIEDLNKRYTVKAISDEYKNEDNANMRLILYKSQNAEICIRIDDITKLHANNKRLIKLFVFFMYQFNKHCVENGKIIDYTLEFPLKLLQEEGLYSSVQGARRAINEAKDVLQSYKLVSEYIKHGESIESGDNDFDSIVLFTRIKIKDGKCRITFNNEVGTDFFINYFTILPAYCFSLSTNPFNMLYYIFYKARMSKTLGVDGFFDIGLREIWNFLMLPNEHETKSIKDKTLIPMIESVKEILNKHKEYYKYDNNELDIKICYDGNDNPKTLDILYDGYLRIILSGKYFEYFENTIERKKKKIEQSKRKHKNHDNNKHNNKQ